VSGLVAIFNIDGAPVDAGLLRTMLDVPPCGAESQVWTDGPIALASAPFYRRGNASAAESDRSLLVRGPLAVLFTGRLDDREALRSSLARRGEDDASSVDIELIALAYRKWGSACVDHLLGDFAFCIWDRERRTLLGARDHFGVIPFYLAQRGATLIVSNVLRSIRRHPLVSDRLDDRSVGDLLLFSLAMDPSRTLFADVSRLPAAHTVVAGIGRGPRVDRYWALQAPTTAHDADDRELVSEFATALQRAVADRVRGGPIGVLMSGGLDSSSVAAMAARALEPSTPRRLRAFTGVYETVAEDEERYYSSLVAATLGIQIDHVPLDGYRLFDRWNSGGLPPEPTAEPMTATTGDMLARAAEHSPSVLTGDGGDPLLLPTTLLDQIGRVPLSRLIAGFWTSMRTDTRPPLGIRSLVRRWTRAGAIATPPWLAAPLLRSFDPRGRLLEIEGQRAVDHGPRSAAVNALVNLWWPSSFETYDAGATGHPVAIRYPFFDVRLVDVALRLPSFPFCVNKRVLREAMRGALPDTVRLRPKTPLALVPESFNSACSVHSAVGPLDAVPGIEH
jgi:asparagine synthase (glutamine-hydrolysing)